MARFRPRTIEQLEIEGAFWESRWGKMMLSAIILGVLATLAFKFIPEHLEKKALRSALHSEFGSKCQPQLGDSKRCDELIQQHDFICFNRAYYESLPADRRGSGGHHRVSNPIVRDPHEVYWHCMMRKHDPSWKAPEGMFD